MERAADHDFDEMYRAGTAPWDIGVPQPAFVRLAEAGRIISPVLDSGCGTGQNALHLAGLGHEVVGVDASPIAIERARSEAANRGVTAAFAVGDVLELGRLERTFSTVIDSGVFHVFPDPERARYVDSLHGVIVPGGRYLMLCFSELEPDGWGPRRVTRDEIRDAFSSGWEVEDIEPANLRTTREQPDVAAWLASVRRI